MQWKRYKALPSDEKRDETYYIIGLDIGNDSSAIAFYNSNDGNAEIIDLSGGYGRPSSPTVMQYITDTKEWVYGEYAIQNLGTGKEVTLSSMVERLGRSEYVDVGSKAVSVINVIGLYIKDLMSNVYNINPKAEIAGIVASIPSYLSVRAKEELALAFKYAGYDKELIAFVSDRECVFNYYFYNGDDGKKIDGKYLLLDYGSREVRGGVYNTVDDAVLRSISSLFENEIGTQIVEERVNELYTNYYLANNPIQARKGGALDRSTADHIAMFTYGHKDILFQKAIKSKPAKLYFNFAFPPFQQTVKWEDANNLIDPFRKRFDKFILQVMENAVSAREVNTVICVGGGFEMLWAKEAVESLFPQSKLCMFKNSKAVTAMGAAVTAAKMLGAADGEPMTVEDRHQLPVDIGILTGDSFIPIAESNSFWWQTHPKRMFIINNAVDGDVPLNILSRTPEGETNILSDVPLRDLPKRPKGTTRLSIRLKFTSDSEAVAHIKDLGFGEIFPKSNYEQEIKVTL